MNLHSEFLNPPSYCRPIPFWFWNGKLDATELVQQIADMHQKGIGGFFIHARFGLDTPYLSPEWMDCVKTAIDAASKFGMEVWLYDEANFPSGLGGLEVTRHPEFRSHFVDLIEARITGPAVFEMEVPPGVPLSAVALRCESDGRFGERYDLTNALSDSRLVWAPPPGEWLLSVFVLQVLHSPTGKVFGVDYLNPDATNLFLHTTHEVYDREIGEHFGKTVKGFFVDEPTLLPWHHDISWYGKRAHAKVVVWSPCLEEELERQCITAREILPHLFYDLDHTTGDKRVAFYRTVSRLYVSSFLKPYSRWCEEHGLLLTGHLLLEEGLYCNTIFQADPVPALASMHIPGTDHLGLNAEAPYGGWSHLPKTMTNAQGEKLVSSVSHLSSKPRTLSETFGCAGWGLSLADMKRITDWQFGLGIDLMCPHALFYTIEGYRKADAPPAHNRCTWWRYYSSYSDYVGRLSLMLSGGRHVCQVAVLYPLDDFQRVYRIGLEGTADRHICDVFDAVCSVLPKIGFDYDILPPSYLAGATVADGLVQVGGERFEAIVVPGITPVDPSTARKLHECEQSGVPIIRAKAPPGNGWDDLVWLGNWLREQVACTIEPDFRVESAQNDLSPVRCLHRVKEGRDVYFLANTSGDEIDASLSFRGQMRLENWDLETGERHELLCRVDGNRTFLDYVFPSYGSALLISSEGSPPAALSGTPRVTKIVELGPVWDFVPEAPNCLHLDRWDFEMQTHGNTERFEYHTGFECEGVPANLLLLLDDIDYRHAFMGGMDITVKVNDRTWRNPAFGWYMDRGFKTLDIKQAVRLGSNAVSLSIAHDAWSGEPKLMTSIPKLLGDFVVVDAETKVIRKPSGKLTVGSWTEQGYPLYSGSAIYSCAFELGSAAREVRLVVKAVGDMFEAHVNGKPAGVRAWPPWVLDISEYVIAGHNALRLVVTNSMQNFLEGDRKPSGLLGSVYLELN